MTFFKALRMNLQMNWSGLFKREESDRHAAKAAFGYLGFVVVLVSAMAHGLTPKRLQVLQEKLGIDRRTLERWRTWWLENFVQSTFWKEARARFMPVLCESILPLSLCKAFKIDHLARSELLLRLLSFLGPLTTSSFPLK